MKEAGWFDWLQKWWWVATMILALIARLWATAVKTNKKLEELDKIKIHDDNIKQLQTQVDGIERMTADIMRDLGKRGKDNQVIHRTLLAMLDSMVQGDCKGLPAAKELLRNHLIDQ